MVEAWLEGSEAFLVDIKLSPNRLAVFIDKPQGITIEECSALSRHLISELEPGGFLEKHEVEVSSPGMDSPLVVPRQYLRRIGNELRVVSREGRELKGVLTEADEEGISLRETRSRKENKKKIIEEVMHRIPFSDIKEAKLIFNFKF